MGYTASEGLFSSSQEVVFPLDFIASTIFFKLREQQSLGCGHRHLTRGSAFGRHFRHVEKWVINLKSTVEDFLHEFPCMNFPQQLKTLRLTEEMTDQFSAGHLQSVLLPSELLRSFPAR